MESEEDGFLIQTKKPSVIVNIAPSNGSIEYADVINKRFIMYFKYNKKRKL
jgi:hypothetical protein